MDAKAEFETCLQELHFKRRCAKLAALGKHLRAEKLSNEELVAKLRSMVGDGASSFAELNLIIVAEAARATGYPIHILDHSSQCVRRAAVQCELLTTEQAREQFLSSSSSRQIKLWLLRQQVLPCDSEVMEQAQRMFGGQGLRRVLGQSSDPELVKKHFEEGTVRALPNMRSVAKRFPAELLELANEKRVRSTSWDWILEICKQIPEKVFEPIMVGNRRGLPMWWFQKAGDKAVSWGWRKHPERMVDLCARLQIGGHIETMIRGLSTTKTTATCITFKKKIDFMTKIFASLDHSQKTTEMATLFVQRFPKQRPNRPHESQFVVDGFWKIVGDMGSTERKKTLEWSNFELVRYFLKRLPVACAVDNFMKLLSEAEIEADHSLFLFVQSEICKGPEQGGDSDSDDEVGGLFKKGGHDEQMQRVFLKYLTYSENETKILELFQSLLKSCSTMDVIQAAFDSLTTRLHGTTQHGLLLSVVHRMKELQAALTAKLQSKRARNVTKAKKPKTAGAGAKLRKADGQLALPIHWLHFVQLPKKGVSPYISFLHATLSTGLGEEDLLGSVVAFYGRAFFWDAVEEVMTSLGRDQEKNRASLISQQQPDNTFLANISKESLAAARAAMLRQSEGGNTTLPEPASVAEAVKKAYFEQAATIKKDTYARCGLKRETGYKALMQAVKGQQNPEIFDDMLPFICQRLAPEQDDVRLRCFSFFLDGKIVPVECWERHFVHMKALYAAGTKNLLARDTRQPGDCTIVKKMAEMALQQCLYTWQDGDKSEMARFWAESLKVLLQPIGGAAKSLQSVFREAAKQRDAEGLPIAMGAGKFILEWSREAEATLHEKLSTYLEFVDGMLSGVEHLDGFDGWNRSRGRLSQVWEHWPCVKEIWEELLTRSQSETSEVIMKYVLRGVVDQVIKLQALERLKNEPEQKWEMWCEPLECQAYKKAVEGFLALIGEMEYPKSLAARTLQGRIRSLTRLEMGTRVPMDLPNHRMPVPELKELLTFGKQWSVPPPLFSQPVVEGVERELELISKLHKTRQPEKEGDWEQHRDVVWCISYLGRVVTGSKVSELLQQAIAGLDAEFEGRGRVVREHSSIKQALSDEKFATSADSFSAGSTDVLSPLLEAWLTAPDTSRASGAAVMERVDLLMKRDDGHLLLFFGHRFADLVSQHHQDYFHHCLPKLTAPGEGSPQFYHFEDHYRLARIAAHSPGWVQRQSHDTILQQVKTWTMMWHKDTQALFLQKALFSTQPLDLVLVPRLEFVDGTERASELLDQHPKEQTPPVPVDKGFVVVLPAGGATQGVVADVERRFLEMGKAEVKDQVKSNELEQILSALGFADDALQALRVLGKFAGQVKKAKDAVLRAILNLSPSQTRTIVKEVLFGPKAGVSMCVAGVRTISDLRLPQPLELYRTAWREGTCHRDIAADILSRLATTPLQDSTPEDLKSFFDFFNMKERAEDWKPVGELFLGSLESAKHCVLPFLMTMLPEIGLKSGCVWPAATCLLQCKDYPEEVVVGTTTMVQHYRLAQRASRIRSSGEEKAKDAELVEKITRFWSPSKLQLKMGPKLLQQCPLPLMKKYIQELRLLSDGGDAAVSVASLLEAWLKFLKLSVSDGAAADDADAAWAQVSEIEGWLKSRGSTNPADFTSYAQLLTKAVCDGEQALGRSGAGSQAAVERSVPYLVRLLTEHLPEVPVQHEQVFEDAEKEVLGHWLELLVSLRASKKAFGELFARCPKKYAPPFAQKVVKALVEAASAAFSKASPEPEASQEFLGVAWSTLEWLQTVEDEVQATEIFQVLLKIGEMLVASSAPGAPSLEATIAQISKSSKAKKLSQPHCLQFVENLLAISALLAPRGREALEFLVALTPTRAAALWPKVLTMKEIPEDNTPSHLKDGGDVQRLLEVCTKYEVDLPEISAKTCPLAAIASLASSELPTARVLAVEVMQERSLGKEGSESELLAKLREDPCSMVRLAASLYTP